MEMNNTSEQKRRVKVHICGMDYMLFTDESDQYMREIGDDIDEMMAAIMRDDSRISVTMAAILTALTIADRERKASANADHLRGQLTSYLDASNRARVEADNAKTEVERLRAELKKLRGGNI